METEGRLDPSVPERYVHLIKDVLRRLPLGWDRGVLWRVTASNDQPSKGFAYVSSTDRAVMVVTLYPGKMNQLSDDACRFVIAHEFGHVAPTLPLHAVINGRHYLFVDGKWKISSASAERLEELYEDVADLLVEDWGLTQEAAAFEREIANLTSE